MSQKRKLDEYHDPDYPQPTEIKRNCIESIPAVVVVVSPEEKLKKIRSIIVREFAKELSAKENEIIEIDNRITFTKKLLHKVRYAVVSHYYNKKKLNADEIEYSTIFQNDPKKGVQNAIHPSVKKILGTNIKDYDDLLKILPTRQAAKTAKSTIKEKLKSLKDKRLERMKLGSTNLQSTYGKDITEIQGSTSSQYKGKFEKPIATLNRTRGGNQSRHLIVVGNTSKYIGFEKSSDNVTHKWLIYVQTKTSYSIEKLLHKVRFFLHPSYKPNDIIDVNCAPFQLSRRGWGEFPVRIQLFFHTHLQQKPVQLVHNLILDKKLTGLQTLGAETILEIWLRTYCFKTTETITKSQFEENSLVETGNIASFFPESIEHQSNNKILSPNRNVQQNLMDFLNNIESSSIPSDIDNIEPSLLLSPNNNLIIPDLMTSTIKSELEWNDNNIYSDIFKSLPTSPCKIATSNLTEKIKNTNEKLKTFGLSKISIKEEPLDNIIENNLHHETPNNEKTSQTNNNYELIKPNIQNATIKNHIIVKNGKMYFVDPLSKKLRQKNQSQQSLLKPQISLLKVQNNDKSRNKSFYNPLNYDHDYTSKREFQENPSQLNVQHLIKINAINKTIPSIKNTVLMQKFRTDYRQEFEIKFLSKNFLNEIRAIQYLLRKIPLINKLAVQSDYRISFPFVLRNLDIYQKFIPAKRKANEWLQAKYFSQLMQKHKQFNESFWRTKEIILYARLHSYAPPTIEDETLNLQKLIKYHFVNEQNNNSNSCDFNNINDVNKWIETQTLKINNKYKIHEEIININVEDVEDHDDQLKNKLKEEKKNKKSIQEYKDKHWMALDEKYENEGNLISNMCFEIGYRLHPEEIKPGVMHESVKLCLISAMKCFVEDLVRKSISQQYYDEELPLNILQSKHIKNVIESQSRFDFLSTKFLIVPENNLKQTDDNKK